MDISSINVTPQTGTGNISSRSAHPRSDPTLSVVPNAAPLPPTPSTEQEPNEITEVLSPTSEDESSTLEASVDYMNKLMQSLNNSLQFSLDKDTGKTVVKVIDSNTQETIKQMPSEEALALTKALDKLKGLFVQQKA